MISPFPIPPGLWQLCFEDMKYTSKDLRFGNLWLNIKAPKGGWQVWNVCWQMVWGKHECYRKQGTSGINKNQYSATYSSNDPVHAAKVLAEKNKADAIALDIAKREYEQRVDNYFAGMSNWDPEMWMMHCEELCEETNCSEDCIWYGFL